MLKNKVALVTGGGRGIGKAIALRLAEYGADVIINYNGSKEQAEETAEEIRGMGRKVSVRKADISRSEDCKGMFAHIKEEYGRLDILVNNAGITRDDLSLRMKEEDFDAVINTNLKGTFLCMQQAAQLMMKQRYGKIVNISSISGVRGNAGQINYAAAKAGLIGMTKTMAKELASRNIYVNAVAPGYIESDMTNQLSDKVKERIVGEIPLKRTGKPEEIAEVTAFLASDKASYITGQVILADGGMGI